MEANLSATEELVNGTLFVGPDVDNSDPEDAVGVTAAVEVDGVVNDVDGALRATPKIRAFKERLLGSDDPPDGAGSGAGASFPESGFEKEDAAFADDKSWMASRG